MSPPNYQYTSPNLQYAFTSVYSLWIGELDIIVMGTITGAPLLPFCVLVTEAWNMGQGHKPPRVISRSCQDEQLGPCTIPQFYFTPRKFNRINEKRFGLFFRFRFLNSETKMKKWIVFCPLYHIVCISNRLNNKGPLCLYVPTIQFSVGTK